MSPDEVKLVTSLAMDKSYKVAEWANATSTRQWLLVAMPEKNDDESVNWDTEWGNATVFCLDDVVQFVREYCLYDNSSPNMGTLNLWSKRLLKPYVQLADLTPDTWRNIVQSKVIQKLQQP